MGTCDLCGQGAGFMRKRHKECETKQQEALAKQQAGRREMVDFVARSIFSPADTNVADGLMAIATRCAIPDEDPKEVLVYGWERAVEQALDNGVLTIEEEETLGKFREQFSLTQDDLDSNGMYTRMIKSAVLREVLEGKLPERLRIEGQLPFNMQKNERLVWAFPDATYYEARTKTHYEGGMAGMSQRIAKGTYLRIGGFRGHPVKTTETVEVGVGLMGLTDKHIYFASPQHSFRIRYDKIVSFSPRDDGIALQRDAQTAKPQSFATGDGWFTYNLVVNLAQGDFS